MFKKKSETLKIELDKMDAVILVTMLETFEKIVAVVGTDANKEHAADAKESLEHIKKYKRIFEDAVSKAIMN